MEKLSEISVGSSSDYDDLIAEVKFGSVAGIIVSKEPSDSEYMVSIHSFCGNAADNFDYNRNIPSEKIPLNVLLAALDEAKDRLESLG